jgi:hypothetical protein
VGVAGVALAVLLLAAVQPRVRWGTIVRLRVQGEGKRGMTLAHGPSSALYIVALVQSPPP